MSSAPDDRLYSPSHEWAQEDGGRYIVGITEHAVSELGDLVFLELPKVGTDVVAGEPFGEIESVKAVSELNAPLSGVVVAVNEDLSGNLEALADTPYEDGWMIKIEPSDTDETENLLRASEYLKQLEEDE